MKYSEKVEKLDEVIDQLHEVYKSLKGEFTSTMRSFDSRGSYKNCVWIIKAMWDDIETL